MRNLKRALSLTLASVMLLGMMVVGSSALSFNDADDISNVTAATVLEELGVMQGDGQGNFMPEQSVTRAQMAILICRILYGDKLQVNQFSGVTKYTDVAADAYYTGYINLATQLGIINGYGDGRFGPDDTVTTAQAALMLSRALGYFKANELEGQDWALTAVAQATKLDMFGRLDLPTNGLLARDNVAEMVFNTLTNAVPVQYSERWGVYYTDSQSILEGVKFNYRNSLGYQNFDLVYNEGQKDDFDRPATEWGIGTIKNGSAGIDDKGNIEKNGANIKTSIIKAINEADETYTAEVKISDIYKDLGLSETVAADKVTFYRNGKDEDETDGGKIQTNDKADLSDQALSKANDKKIGGNGVLTQVWYGVDDKTATITMIDTYVGKINSVVKATSSANRYVKLKETSMPTYGSEVNDKFETEAFDVDDLVSFTIAWNGAAYDIQTVKTLELSNTAVLTKWVGSSVLTPGGDKGTSNSNFTAGETYKYSENKRIVDGDGNDLTNGSGIAAFDVNKSEINIYLDDYGYALYVSGVEGETNYAAVIGIGASNTHGSETKGATLLLPDGTQKAVTAKSDYWADMSAVKEEDYADVKDGQIEKDGYKNLVTDGVADIVTYTVGDDNVYKLTPVGVAKVDPEDKTTWVYTGQYSLKAGDDDGEKPTAANLSTFTNGKSELKINTVFNDTENYSAAGVNTYYTTSKTIFMVATQKNSDKFDGRNYNVYVGFENAPSFSKSAGDINGMAFALNKQYSKQIDVVYIDAVKMAGSGADTYIAFNPEKHKITTTSDGKYYTLPAIVKGEETTLMIDAEAPATWNTLSGDKVVIGDDTTKLEDAVKGVYAISNMVRDKGIITDCDVDNADAFNATGGSYVTGTVKDRDAVLGIGGDKDTATFWAYTKDTKVFYVDKDYETIRVSSINATTTDDDDLVYACQNTDTKTLTDVIIVEVVKSTSEKEPEPDAKPIDDTYVYEVNDAGIGSYLILTKKSSLNSTQIRQAIRAYLEKNGEKVDGIEYNVEVSADGKTATPYVLVKQGEDITKMPVIITPEQGEDVLGGAQAAEDLVKGLEGNKNIDAEQDPQDPTKVIVTAKPDKDGKITEDDVKKAVKDTLKGLYSQGIVTIQYGGKTYDWSSAENDFVEVTRGRVTPAKLSEVLAAAIAAEEPGKDGKITLELEEAKYADKDGVERTMSITFVAPAVAEEEPDPGPEEPAGSFTEGEKKTDQKITVEGTAAAKTDIDWTSEDKADVSGLDNATIIVTLGETKYTVTFTTEAVTDDNTKVQVKDDSSQSYKDVLAAAATAIQAQATAAATAAAKGTTTYTAYTDITITATSSAKITTGTASTQTFTWTTTKA